MFISIGSFLVTCVGLYFVPLNMKTFLNRLEIHTSLRAKLLGATDENSYLYRRIQENTLNELIQDKKVRLIRSHSSKIVWGHRLLVATAFISLFIEAFTGNSIPFTIANLACAFYFFASSVMSFHFSESKFIQNVYVEDLFSPRFVQFILGTSGLHLIKEVSELVPFGEKSSYQELMATLDSMSDEDFEVLMKNRKTLWEEAGAVPVKNHFLSTIKYSADSNAFYIREMIENRMQVRDNEEQLISALHQNVQRFIEENFKTNASVPSSVFSPALEDLEKLLQDPSLSEASQLRIKETIDSISKHLREEESKKEQESEQERVDTAIKAATHYHNVL